MSEQVKTKDLTDLLNSLGIERSTGDSYNLILYNDDVNSMEHVIDALYNICKLNEQESFIIMLEAHTKGRAVAKKGEFKEISDMKKGLNQLLINADVEKC